MTAVFVHGVPETPAVWSGLLAAVDLPGSVALPLPGFDGVRPEGFGATMDEYAAWLVAQLERLDDPADLVGHDWGGGFVVRVVSTRPELVRSWVTDAAGIGDPGFEWHDLAKIWQTPQAGGRLLGPAAGGPGPGAGRRLPGVRGARGGGPGPGIARQPYHG
jgi:pimeloyl-ACP methyl ester carboxylesterase